METCLATHVLCIFFPCLGNTGNRVASVGDTSGITDNNIKILILKEKNLIKSGKSKLLKLKPSKETD